MKKRSHSTEEGRRLLYIQFYCERRIVSTKEPTCTQCLESSCTTAAAAAPWLKESVPFNCEMHSNTWSETIKSNKKDASVPFCRFAVDRYKTTTMMVECLTTVSCQFCSSSLYQHCAITWECGNCWVVLWSRMLPMVRRCCHIWS